MRPFPKLQPCKMRLTINAGFPGAAGLCLEPFGPVHLRLAAFHSELCGCEGDAGNWTNPSRLRQILVLAEIHTHTHTRC